MDKYWRDWIEQYANDDFYWYQPKGLAVSLQNLDRIKQELRVLRQFEGRPWQQTQNRYARALERARLFEPRVAKHGSRDYAAIARMRKEVFDSLGLAWISEQSIVVITQAGDRFLSADDGTLPDLVHNQLCRYQYPNPAVGRKSEGAGIFPYAALLAVLAHFPEGIPSESYELFLARMRSEGDIGRVVDLISHYEHLPRRTRQSLRRRVESIPLVRRGRIVAPNRRTSLYDTIRLDRSYMLSFLKTPGLVAESDGVLRIESARHSEVQSMVQRHFRENCYIEFENVEDWIAFYGEIGKRPTHAEALAYYMRRGAIENSKKAFEAAKSRRQLPDRFRHLDAHGFRRLQILEKTLEDFLEFNLELIEAGLKFVKRQYPTDTGPLDILARDARSRWVVIELKRGRSGDEVIGQLQRYRGFILREKARGNEKKVRAFVVAPEIDDRVIAAARGAHPTLEIYEFVVSGKSRRRYPEAEHHRARPKRRRGS